MTWRERLLKESERLVEHGEGKLELLVLPRNIGGEEGSLISITSGKTYRFTVVKEELEED